MSSHHTANSLDRHHLEGCGKAVGVVTVQGNSGAAVDAAGVAVPFVVGADESILLLFRGATGKRFAIVVLVMLCLHDLVLVPAHWGIRVEVLLERLILQLGRLGILAVVGRGSIGGDQNRGVTSIALDGVVVGWRRWKHRGGFGTFDHSVGALEGLDGFLGEEAIADVHLSCAHLGVPVGKHAARLVGAEALREEVAAHLCLEALGEDVAFILEGDVDGRYGLLLHGNILVSLGVVLVVVKGVVVVVVWEALNVENGGHDFM